ncbi:MAG: hypothetical protein ACI9WU_000510 [Myxococcota bacterium]|jgi:hypothetical protein
MQHQVVGYGWRDGSPELRLRDRDPIAIQGDLAFSLVDKRHCIGWRDRTGPASQLRPCPTLDDTSGVQCGSCSRREGFWACMTCDGFECPALQPSMLDYCRGEHVLYLACFGGNSVKVGTASGPRRVARLIEQGPLAAGHIARAPGPVIKQMEALAVRAGLVEAVRRSRKWQEYQSRATQAEGRRRIERAYRMVLDRLPEHYHEHLHAPDWVPLEAGPQGLHNTQMIRIEPGDKVAGRVLGARGHVVILDDGAGPFAVDLAAFRSWYLDLDPAAGSGPVRQLGLFG